MTRVASSQAFLARFLAEPDFEARVRASPVAMAREHGIEPEEAERIARIAPARVEAFRRSRRHKQEVREGKAPRRI